MPAKKKPEPEDQLDDVEIIYGDLKVTVPRDGDDWPTKAELARLKAASTNDLSDWLAFIEQLLGSRQWEHVITRLNRGDFYSFVKTFNETVIEECSV